MARLFVIILFLCTSSLSAFAAADIERPVVLVTGAFRGLGMTLATDLYNKGFKVVATGRNLSKAPEWAKTPSERGLGLELNLTDLESIQSAYQEAVAYFGHVDVIIHNAGSVFFEAPDKITPADLTIANQVNYTGPAYLTQLALPDMKKNKFGRIIYISSSAAIVLQPSLVAYTASKRAGESYFLALHQELKTRRDFRNSNVEVKTFRLSFVNGTYEPTINQRNDATKAELKFQKFMDFLRRNSPTTPETVLREIENEIFESAPNGSAVENVGIDGKLLSLFSILPRPVQKVCTDLLVGFFKPNDKSSQN